MGHFKNIATDMGTVGEAMEEGRYNRRSSTATRFAGVGKL